MSYFMVVFFLFSAFNKYRDEIKKLTGKDLISLRKLKSDFEIAIHRAFECFKACIYIYGLDKYWCLTFLLRFLVIYFTSLRLWRRVQTGGEMIDGYDRNKKFKYFIRAKCALPFIQHLNHDWTKSQFWLMQSGLVP